MQAHLSVHVSGGVAASTALQAVCTGADIRMEGNPRQAVVRPRTLRLLQQICLSLPRQHEDSGLSVGLWLAVCAATQGLMMGTNINECAPAAGMIWASRRAGVAP